MKDSEILTAAKELIEDRKHWCQGRRHQFYRNDVEQWCAIGALAWILHTTVELKGEEVERLRRFLNDFSSEVAGQPMGIIALNDCSELGHKFVIQAYEKAIAAKQEVGE